MARIGFQAGLDHRLRGASLAIAPLGDFARFTALTTLLGESGTKSNLRAEEQTESGGELHYGGWTRGALWNDGDWGSLDMCLGWMRAVECAWTEGGGLMAVLIEITVRWQSSLSLAIQLLTALAPPLRPVPPRKTFGGLEATL